MKKEKKEYCEPASGGDDGRRDPWISTPVFAVVSPNVDLGDAVLSSRGILLPSAAGFRQRVRTILISFSDNVTSGDEIDLPADTPTGSRSPAAQTITITPKRINLDGALTQARSRVTCAVWDLQ